MRTSGAHENQRDRDAGQQRDRQSQHEASRHAVGKLAGGNRQEEYRCEFEQPDEAEIERMVVDVVHLPADRDSDHLARAVHRQHDGGKQRKVALA